MRYAVSWSGGKDSTLALDRARRAGLEVAALCTIYEGNSGRVRFHGVPVGLIEEQALALGLPLLAARTHPDDYEAVFLRLFGGLRDQGIDGVVFGNIHLAEIRGWFEERTRALGLAHEEPLWGTPTSELAAEVIQRGFRPLVVSVDLARSDPDWLGRPFDDDLVADLAARPGLDLCGERGEYHTFVWDGPGFRRPARFRRAGLMELEGHAILDLAAV